MPVGFCIITQCQKAVIGMPFVKQILLKAIMTPLGYYAVSPIMKHYKMAQTEINKKIVLIIPCYNEAENVAYLFNEISHTNISGYTIFPLFINDASKDSTLVELKKLNACYLNNPINLGIGGTVQLGFKYAKKHNFDIAVQMDGDGQHPPSELHKLLVAIEKENADCVIASRFINKQGFQSSGSRRVGIKLLSGLNKFLTGITIKDSTSGYRAYSKNTFDDLIRYYPDEYPEPEVIVYLANLKAKITEVAVEMRERQGGNSSIYGYKTIYYMSKVIVNTLFLHLKMKFYAIPATK